MGTDLSADCVVATGFEPVADEFERNFSARGELGAAFCAVVEGQTVVDLWGGVADRVEGRPWERDTLQLIFSGTKGLVAICMLMLIDRGLLDLDDRVCRHWPEFSAGGKDEVTVREVVTHTARLPGLTRQVAADELADDRKMAELLAVQAQFDDPRALRTYHALTYGWLCGELVRRVDGRSIGRFFAEEIAGPLQLDIYIGLPADLEPRVSRLELADSWGQLPVFDPSAMDGDELMQAVWANPVILSSESFPWNSSLYHQAEIPGANAIGTARAIAMLYAALDQLISPEALALGATELERRHDALLEDEQSFGVGFELQGELRPFGPPPDAFGHTGAGGSAHGMWPRQRTSFSYAMNLMHDDYPDGDPRPRALLATLYSCIEKKPEGTK